jgi:hypothetical protein
VNVQRLGIEGERRTPVLVLQEAAGDRVLPIWIGQNEAGAIAIELAGLKFGRPLTHDLLTSVIRGFGGRLARVIVNRIEENLYRADMVLQRDDEEFVIDARPSDAIAIAVRMKAEIFVHDELFGTGRLPELDNWRTEPPASE